MDRDFTNDQALLAPERSKKPIFTSIWSIIGFAPEILAKPISTRCHPGIVCAEKSKY
jgi:hypothetical protein